MYEYRVCVSLFVSQNTFNVYMLTFGIFIHVNVCEHFIDGAFFLEIYNHRYVTIIKYNVVRIFKIQFKVVHSSLFLLLSD